MNRQLRRKDNFLFYPRNLILIVIILILVDQLAKSVFFQGLLCNKGLFLGYFDTFDFLIVPSMIFLTVLIYFEKNKYAKVGFFFIFAGGLSNLIDRFLYDCVRDFIPLFTFSKFNTADAWITLGVALVIFGLLSKKND